MKARPKLRAVEQLGGGSAAAAPGLSEPAPIADERFEWTAHPARERPWTGVLVLFAIALLPGWFVGQGHFAWALFGSFVLLASLHRFYFATYFEISDSGVTMRSIAGKRRVMWSEVRGVSVGEGAAWLGTGAGRGWWAARRGILIQFGRAREQVVARLRARLPEELWRSSAARA